jgi:hypothetical protein
MSTSPYPGLSPNEEAALGEVQSHLMRLNMETPPAAQASIPRRALEHRAGDYDLVIKEALAIADELGIAIND